MSINIEEGVFLFHSEPRVIIFGLFHNLGATTAVVSSMRLELVVKGLTKDKFVITETEGITVDGNWLQEDIRISTFGLFSGRSIKVPDRELCTLNINDSM